MIAGYEIVKKLVEGETAVVYLARPEQGMDYAIALVLRPDVAADTSASLRFMMEVETAKALQHPHVLRWVDDGALDDGRPYLLSEPVAENVATLLDVRGPQPIQEGLALAAQVASALEYLHAQNVVHGLLSPVSVFLSPTEIPQVKVVDLTLAVRKLDGAFPAAKLPPEYLAPEVLRGQAPGPASDVYGLGLLLYEILVGSPLMSGKDKEQVRKRQVEEQPSLPVDKLGEAAAIVKRCLQKSPEQRYPSASALREVLVPRAAAAAPVAELLSVDDCLELEPQDPAADYGDEPVTRIQSIASLRAEAVPPPAPPPAQAPGSAPVHLSEPPRPAPAIASAPAPAPASVAPARKKSKLLLGLGVVAAMLVSAGIGIVTALPKGDGAALVPATAPGPTGPTPDPKPAAPEATPKPVDPAPDPKPAAPTPGDPPADPKPADPVPGAPPIAEPAPADPKPADPVLAKPADPKPADPVLAKPADPKPADPAPKPDPKPEEPQPVEKPATAEILLTSAPTGATVERFDTKTRLGRTPMSVTVQRDADLTLTMSVDGYVPMMVKLSVDSPNPTQVLLDKVGAEKPAPPPKPKPRPKPKVNKDVQLDPFGN